MKDRKKIIALVLNMLIILMEVIGLILTIKKHGKFEIQYYTEDSNFLAMITSLIYTLIFFIKKKGDIPKWVNTLKYITTSCLTVTFLVVVFVLAPMYGPNGFQMMMTDGSMLYHHTLCPVVSIISFIFFENYIPEGKKDYFKAILFTINYAIVIVMLNILKIVEGPYPFLRVYEQPIYMSVIWFILIIGGAYLIAILIGKSKRLVAIKTKKTI